MLGCMAFVLFATYTSTQGSLLNYDDERYIAANPWLNGQAESSVWTSFFDGHYHPLTLLSLQWDMHLGSDPILAHHTVNWFLHGLNVAALFWFVITLTGNRKLALGVALLWGLHPAAVESYAWMTERKNLLYTLFFLLACIQYLLYLKSSEKKRMAWVALFFVLSILSKAQGILIVPVLFLLDFWENGRLWVKAKLIEKIPFVLTSILMAYIGQLAQNEAWNLSVQSYGFTDRIFTGSYAFVQYVLHTVFPVNLVPYYPYPVSYGEELGIFHYLSPFALLAFVGLVFYAFRKGAKLWFFGLVWFGVNIVLLLKFLDVPFGSYLMADRYAYVPMIGLLIPLVDQVFKIARKYIKAKQPDYIVMGMLMVVFMVVTHRQIQLWKSSESLWKEVAEVYPSYPHALNMLALGYISEGNVEDAVKSFQLLNELDSTKSAAPVNLAVLYEQMGESSQAERQLELAIVREPEDGQVLEKAVILNLRWGKLKQALEYSMQAVKLFPDNQEFVLLHSRALAQVGKVNEAVELLESQPSSPGVNEVLAQLRQLAKSPVPSGGSSNRGIAKMFMDQAVLAVQNGNDPLAIENFNKAIEADSTMYESYANRGTYYAKKGIANLALADFQKAIDLQPEAWRVHAMLGLLYAEMGNVEASCEHYNIASRGIQIDPRIMQKCNQLGL